MHKIFKNLKRKQKRKQKKEQEEEAARVAWIRERMPQGVSDDERRRAKRFLVDRWNTRLNYRDGPDAYDRDWDKTLAALVKKDKARMDARMGGPLLYTEPACGDGGAERQQQDRQRRAPPPLPRCLWLLRF